MNSMTHPMTFAVRVENNTLIVNKLADGQNYSLYAIELGNWPSFLLDKTCVICRYKYASDSRIEAETEAEAANLINLMVEALLQYKADISATKAAEAAQSKRNMFKAKVVGAVVLVALAAWKFDVWTTVSAFQGSDVVISNAAPAVTPAALRPAHVATPAANVPVEPIAAEDGWLLPQSVRALLPDKLRKATERQLFTVEYSNGHARTVYVFADPNCPNCQRLEPSLKAAADAINIVAFPVAIIGKDKSIAEITPVLCMPAQQRLAAWDALFSQDLDALTFGKEKPVSQEAPAETDAADCGDALKALGINEVAYQTYRIPGTPWAISDDGRYVPQSVLRDPAQLQAFLEHKEAANEPK